MKIEELFLEISYGRDSLLMVDYEFSVYKFFLEYSKRQCFLEQLRSYLNRWFRGKVISFVDCDGVCTSLLMEIFISCSISVVVVKSSFTLEERVYMKKNKGWVFGVLNSDVFNLNDYDCLFGVMVSLDDKKSVFRVIDYYKDKVLVMFPRLDGARLDLYQFFKEQCILYGIVFEPFEIRELYLKGKRVFEQIHFF